MRAFLPVVLLATGCSIAAADHERLGDRAYREGRFLDAVAEYRAAVKSGAKPRTWAKLGAAALHERDLGTAVEAFAALEAADATRASEAAAGLERVAIQAERGGPAELVHLAGAVRALRTVAPGRPLGRFALAPTTGLPASEALGALPAALASAEEGRTVDSLLVAYGTAQRVTTACEAATRTLKTVLRRSRDVGLRKTASVGMGTCALRLGLDAMDTEQTEAAERWFEQAVAAAGATPAGWRASIGLGDARLKQGDILGAAIAYQVVISAAGVPDSLTKMAAEKLNLLGGGGSPAPPEVLGR
ncbi:MAG: tetratricopeptide repeat protein [Gemmatimonadales bacterium]|nr:tetratricopeptide repeat protein [Gemmatimonadales bacterium]